MEELVLNKKKRVMGRKAGENSTKKANVTKYFIKGLWFWLH